MTFTVIPAIDIREGQVVRLKQGDYAQQTVYSHDPLDMAQRYAQAGAKWLHVVDLDAAKTGEFSAGTLLQMICRQTDLQVQIGGGIRNQIDLQQRFDDGAKRAVIGTLAVREPALVIGWLKKFGSEAIVIALDTRCDDNGIWQLPVAGWTQNSGVTLFDLLKQYIDAGLKHLLCTDIERDGMLTGINAELYRQIHLRFPDIQIQASGGLRDVTDVTAAKNAGAGGVILGRALLEGRINLPQALSC